jgi:hypothetical protein
MSNFMGVSKGLAELGYKNMTESFCERVPALVNRREEFYSQQKGSSCVSLHRASCILN